ncbi:hypothetical protein DFH08DRAFT_828361 [Mycena albidolilacea]|uniref:Uncharacterized protein n=1 Tax=Mycena albidolilacea TaxID=1033008 RepID=A0AAD6YWS2_9AGAR|nr:hypothetical protein DFH08DRAFT_828361 [Mycena albidolilacea]
MVPRYSPFASPHYAGFSAHVRHISSMGTAVTNDDLRSTHLPYAIHRQCARKTQHVSKRGPPPFIGSAFVSFAILTRVSPGTRPYDFLVDSEIAVLREFWKRISFSIFFRSGTSGFVPRIRYLSFRSHPRPRQNHDTVSTLFKSDTSRKTRTQINKSDTFRRKRHSLQEIRHNSRKPDTPLGYRGLAVNAVTIDLLSSFLPPHSRRRDATQWRTRSAFDAPPRNGSSVSDRIFTFIRAKVATGRPNQSKQMTADEMELDGVEMISLEVPAEPDIQPDALEQGCEHNNGLKSLLIPASAPSPVPPPHSKPPKPPLSTRRSSRKRAAFKTHENVPVQKTKKTEAAVAPEPSDSEKKRTKRKPKAWSVRHTDDQIYTSFEFLAQFREEYRALYEDTEPA